jgi:hypothetical protein
MMSVVWVRRSGKKEIWHACADYWDTNTLCGLPIKLKTDYLVDPSGERCNACQEKIRASDRQAAPAAG